MPSWVTSVDKGGKKTTEYKKKWIWRCNVVSMMKEQKMTQPGISGFLMREPQLTAGTNDTEQRVMISDNSVGQSSRLVQPGPDRHVGQSRDPED